jgi:hypothetical protein
MKPKVTRKNDFWRMEHGFKRDQDTWQAFPDEKCKIFAFFYRIETGEGGLEFGVRRSPFAVRRSPFPVRRSPFAGRRSSWFGVHITERQTPNSEPGTGIHHFVPSASLWCIPVRFLVIVEFAEFR